MLTNIGLKSAINMSNKRRGNKGEEIARIKLAEIGVCMPEEIPTPFSVVSISSGGKVRGFFKKKATGDIMGHRTDGVAIRAEVKTSSVDENLTWGIMTKHGKHQIDYLNKHAIHALSFVVWVRHDNEALVMQWPIPGFGPRKSITLERARELNLTDIDRAKGHVNLICCDCEYCMEEL